jgi:hypothetical protein
MTEISKRLVLQYEPGVFSFTRFNHDANDTELYTLARQLNAVQEDEVSRIVTVQVFQLRS